MARMTEAIRAYALAGAHAELTELETRMNRVRDAIAALNHGDTPIVAATPTRTRKPRRSLSGSKTDRAREMQRRMRRYWRGQRKLRDQGLPSRYKTPATPSPPTVQSHPA